MVIARGWFRAYLRPTAPWIRTIGVALVVLALAGCGTEDKPDDGKAKADAEVSDGGSDSSGGGGSDSGSDSSSSSDSAGDSGSSDATTDAATTGPTPCQSDKQCIAEDQVCNTTAGLCVDCLADTDCPAPNACKGFSCAPPASPCQSSKECSPEQVCHKGVGLCVECESDDDCLGGKACLQTVCVDPKLAGKVCTAGETRCEADGQLGVCKADGTGFSATACPSGQVCSGGACQAQVCVPEAKGCDGDKVTQCAADGLSSATLQDCSQTPGSTCLGGSCQSASCSAGEKSCKDAATAVVCADGAWKEQACGAGEGCVQGACAKQVCTPGSKSCIGAQVAVCNASGTAQVPGEDCDTSGKACVAGACVSQQSGFASHGGFVALPDTAAAGGYRVIDQGFRSGMSCGGGYCQVGGFR